MSTASFLHKFVVWAPDMTDPDALHRRMSVRARHMEKVEAMRQSGFLITGGALLSPIPIDLSVLEKKMVGSMMICQADSIETVRKVLESGPYYNNDVWDKERLLILPFLTADV